jgi:RNA ligase
MTHYSISHIDDVLPHIEGRTDFVVAHKDGYSVIDYVFAGTDTFDHPARIECRGLKFAPDGSILARPLHKFFNVGEKPETQATTIDFGQPHTIMDKLDGSMIHPAIVDGEVVFMTRMGRTDVARKAERHLTPAVREWVVANPDLTAVFEWTAPDNRIVVRYDDSRLTLLAIRENVDGGYAWPESLDAHAAEMGVDLVGTHPSRHANASDFLAYARAIQGAEGFVVRFDSGLWVKAKGEDYVLKHKAKDGITQEKNILALVLSGGLDDVLPLLDEADATAAREYAASVEAGILRQASALDDLVGDGKFMAQKDFALRIVARQQDAIRPLLFQVRAGKPSAQAVRERIAANTNSQSQVDANRALHGATWRIA